MESAPQSLLDQDAAMLAQIDAVFERVRETYPGALPCAAGCSHCCVAFFPITALDLVRLTRGLAAAEPETRADILERAVRLMDAMKALYPQWEEPYALQDLPRSALDVFSSTLHARCPVLGSDGACRLYAHRPRICHLQGLSYVDPETGETLPDFCADVFGDEDYRAIPPQPLALFEQWETEHRLRVAAAELQSGTLATSWVTVVAAALLVAARTLQLELPEAAVETLDV